MGRGWLLLSSLFVGGFVLQRGDAAHAQAGSALRSRGREHCVQQNQYKDTQLEPPAAQSRGGGHCERRPVTAVPSLYRPSGRVGGLPRSPDITAFWFIIG